VVCQHLSGGTVFYSYVTVVDPILYLKKNYPDMLGTLAAALYTIGFEQHGAHIVLV
jgi:hypothetical protein